MRRDLGPLTHPRPLLRAVVLQALADSEGALMPGYYVMREADGDECLIWHAETAEECQAWADANVPECERLRTSIWDASGRLYLLPRRIGWVQHKPAVRRPGG